MSKSIEQILNNLLQNKKQLEKGNYSIERAVENVNSAAIDLNEELKNLIEKNLSETTASITKKENFTFVDAANEETLKTNIGNTDYILDNNASKIFNNLSKEDLYTVSNELYKIQRTNETVTSEGEENNEYTSERVSKLLDDSRSGAVIHTIDSVLQVVSDGIGNAGEAAAAASTSIGNSLGAIGQFLQGGEGTNVLLGTLGGIITVMADGMKKYEDGVTETEFGARQETSWHGSPLTSFLNFFELENNTTKEESQRKVNFLKSNPLDSGEEMTSIYGSMIMGTPFLFNELADPTNRSLINSLVKDARYVSFTPGMPKFNGLSYNSMAKNNIFNQTTEPNSMLEYLKKNGIDSEFAEKDKRYYTFQTNYELYYAYLETMLNAIWVKMGLGKGENDTFNLFTFFDIDSNKGGGIKSSGYKKLKSSFKSNSSIGFFINPTNGISESISNSPGGQGDSLASQANANADEYRQMNYLTGMGTGGGMQDAARTAAISTKSTSNLISMLSGTFGGTIDALSHTDSNGGGTGGAASALAKLAKVSVALVSDITTFTTTNDLGAVIQSFATANGMQVTFPNLWGNSSFSKSVSLQFSFVSPYGDPLSIFKYVYVPFCALLCFGMPRQAAENGLVSPFLVRCDIPGLFTSDMAMVADISWTRGGGAGLWTKDGLPRAIDVQVSLADLYPYLSMTKRLSFLSANPSYAVFLDSLSGMLALNDNNKEDSLQKYFKEMINRVNGMEKDSGKTMWNKFNGKKSAAIRDISEEVRSSLSATVDPHAIPWLHNSSIK